MGSDIQEFNPANTKRQSAVLSPTPLPSRTVADAWLRSEATRAAKEIGKFPTCTRSNGLQRKCNEVSKLVTNLILAVQRAPTNGWLGVPEVELLRGNIRLLMASEKDIQALPKSDATHPKIKN